MVRPDPEIVEDGSDGDLLDLDAAVSHHRQAQIHNPVHVIPIRGEVVPQRRRVIRQNLSTLGRVLRSPAALAFCNIGVELHNRLPPMKTGRPVET
jgi:hypothetical protein